MTAGTKSQPLENPIERYLVKACRGQGFLCLKFTSPARGGVPDRIVVSPAQIVFVEVKRPGTGPTRRQQATHAKMRRHGAEVRVLNSQSGVDCFIADLAARGQSLDGHDRDRERAAS